MAKLFIVESASGERIPFLRGVLVESLARAGLSFQDAYLVAQSVRDKLGDDAEITIETLRERVSAELHEHFGEALARSYVLGFSKERQTMVRTETDEVPFSVDILSRSLQACAIDRREALETAQQVHEDLRKGEDSVVDHTSLRQIVYARLKEHCSQAAADRFLSWRRFRDSGLPLIVLVGGITGTGKSTLTTELAY
ncbi:MAG: ATP cone domain-containing protein, partial [Sedimenticolaceae bacterium]